MSDVLDETLDKTVGAVKWAGFGTFSELCSFIMSKEFSFSLKGLLWLVFFALWACDFSQDCPDAQDCPQDNYDRSDLSQGDDDDDDDDDDSLSREEEASCHGGEKNN